MNKKIKKSISLICAMLLLLTGCVRYEANLKVNKNGTIDISIVYAENSEMVGVSGALGNSNNSVLSQEQISEYEAQGYTVSEYQASGFLGYTISKQGLKIKDDGYSLLDTGISIVHTKRGLIHCIDIDLSQSENISDISNSSTYIKQAGGDVTFSIELPIEAKNHNASSVSDDGKKLTWDILSMNVKEPIHVEFQIISPVMLAGAATLVIITIVVLLVFKKKKENI